MAGPHDSAPKKTKVLLIDDNALTRSVLRAILRDEGYTEIREAKDAEVGFKLVQHFAPDLVCLDIQMPGKSGLVLLNELQIYAPGTGVLMITASDDRETIEASLRGGADGYILKPFNAATVLKTVAEVLAKRR
nr:response regulator [uncultured Roseateles sp.]